MIAVTDKAKDQVKRNWSSNCKIGKVLNFWNVNLQAINVRRPKCLAIDGKDNHAQQTGIAIKQVIVDKIKNNVQILYGTENILLGNKR